ncbi:FtsK/SpoIIIE domain-containing protein [Blautia segnis]|uniref:FtsK domain-containing protein n=1 Tax=Blautia segnis TaxID=2763030 RepID=A0A8I0AI24_9FIRM|nr:FtsK/SpoIIIE domain-containing protein [Blautia segnis]MBC5651090.1 hypothetical protein [Blautia segnis]
MENNESLFNLDQFQSSISYHNAFRNNWKRTLQRDPHAKENERWIEYGKGKKAYIVSDLTDIIKDTNMHPDDVEKNKKVFKAFVEKQPFISLDKMPDDFTWYNTTDRGINLRPGKQEGSNRVPKPLLMEGEKSHAIVAGQTGSGKSVFLNSMILNLMAEYPPWELELYLADFKKVEFSRYMNKYKAPHVRACAATSEIDYVQSLIQYIKNKNDDRGRMFSRLGFQKIEDLRKYYRENYNLEVALPRILFIVDEFQQMYLDTDSFQKDAINDLLTSIIKTGRSQGVHLMFCSQELSGALNSQQLANFKVHFALHCSASISSDILGNPAAENIRRGQVILNAKSKLVEDNELYTVPLGVDPEDEPHDEEYFYRMLKLFCGYAKQTNYIYELAQKFYDEDKQWQIEDLQKLLENPAIKKVRMFEGEEFSEDKRRNFMSLVLGRKTTYTNENFDIENIYIDYAKNRCILCVSPNNEDLAYFQKLIAMNLRTMDAANHTINDINLPLNEPEFYDLNPLVSTFYPVEERMRDFGYDNAFANEAEKENYIKQFEEEYVHYRAEELNMLWDRFTDRKNTLEILRQVKNARDYVIHQLMGYLGEIEECEDDEIKKEFIKRFFDAGLNRLKDDDSNVLEFINYDLSFLGKHEEDIRIDLQRYYRYKSLKKCPSYKIFEPSVVFLTGIENMERLPNWFSEYLSNGTDYNILTLIFSTTAVRFEVREASNYVFVSGDNVRIFEDYYGKKPPKGGSGIKFFGTIKNTNKKFAFKKYRCELNEPTAKAINFDSLLGNSY